MAPLASGGVGLETTTHEEPFHRSVKLPADLPLLFVVVPEIQQFVLVTQVTPAR
jgi:hypothetical protein